jgi:SAM-dependent methyltransferase
MNPNEIRELASSFQKSRILLSSVELDIFTNIDDSGSSGLEVMEKLHLDGKACERLLNVLVSLGFLIKKDGLFYNTPESKNYLSRNSPGYLGGLMHSNHLWDTWSKLTEVVRTGKAAQRAAINYRGDDWLYSFISAMHDRGRKQAPAQMAGLDLTGVKSILDVGGGSGAYSMELLTREPGARATVFDLPNVVPITREFIEKEGFSGKIDTCTGDYTKDDLPEGFDMAFLSAVLHSNSFETNQLLIKKCFRSINKNGRIVIQDWIMNDDRTEPLSGAVFSINMLVGTEAGDCYTIHEVTDMLENAGFKYITQKIFDSGLSQVTAVRA